MDRDLRCPVCSERLVRELAGAYTVRSCPHEHGLLVEDAHLRTILEDATVRRIRSLIEAGPTGLHPCPVCAAPLHGIEVQHVPAEGCPVCGSLWFEQIEIERHVHDVRRREFGPKSFVVRVDVEGRADLQPAEVVAGLLAYFEFRPEDSPSSASSSA